jgi:hypothetical protein
LVYVGQFEIALVSIFRVMLTRLLALLAHYKLIVFENLCAFLGVHSVQGCRVSAMGQVVAALPLGLEQLRVTSAEQKGELDGLTRELAVLRAELACGVRKD